MDLKVHNPRQTSVLQSPEGAQAGRGGFVGREGSMEEAAMKWPSAREDKSISDGTARAEAGGDVLKWMNTAGAASAPVNVVGKETQILLLLLLLQLLNLSVCLRYITFNPCKTGLVLSPFYTKAQRG